MEDNEEMENNVEERIGDFKAGSIKEIRLTNFLTYGSAVIQCGPRLNVVVGPNGTGKSTILNAICLGLGGEPKLLGRADDARDYIRHGKDKASLEVHVVTNDPDKPLVVKRIIEKNPIKKKTTSTFFRNGEMVSHKVVKQTVADCNIALHNLCTFLPQDKVGSFSGMTPQQLLIETEKTLDPFFYETHQVLIEKQAGLLDEQQNVETLHDKLSKLKHENQALERAKDLMQERDQAVAAAELLRKKQIWLEFEVERERALELQQRKNAIKNQLKDAKRVLEPLEQEYQALASEKKKLHAAWQTHEDAIKKHAKEIDKQKAKFDNHEDKIEVVLADLLEHDSRSDKLQKQVENDQLRVDGFEEKMQKLPPMADVDADLQTAMESRKRIGKEYDAAKSLARQSERQVADLEENAKRAMDKMARLSDVDSARRRAVFQQFDHSEKISSWIQNNRSLFRKAVSGPIAAEVTCTTPQAAAFLEQHVQNNTWRAFVVESKEDQDLLYKKIRVEMGIPINIILVRNAKEVKRPYSDEKMSTLKEKHGVLGYLDELFTAPEVIRQALIAHAGVDSVVVGNEQTYQSINKKGLFDFLSEPDRNLNQQRRQKFAIFATSKKESFKFTGTVSRYSGEVMTRQDEIFPPKFLGAGVNPQEVQKIKDSLDEIHQEMNAIRPKTEEAEKKKAELELQMQECQTAAESAKKRKQSVLKFLAKRDQALKKLRDSKEALNAADDDKEKKELVKMLMNRVSASIGALDAAAKQQELMMSATILCTGAGASKSYVACAERNAELALVEKKQTFKELEREAVAINDQFKKTRATVAKKKTEADAKAPLQDENGNPTELKVQLEALDVSTLHEVEVALEEAEMKANSIDANPDVIRQYEQRKREIGELEERLETITNKTSTLLGNLQDQRKKWEESLDANVNNINSLFTKYMAEMGCTGEVVLYKGGEAAEEENEDGEKPFGNFDKWGIHILVSFRENEKAQVLSASHQSGGERSVSTIMYLMALQDLMVAPFRCVDEINQGLDERNERLVFSRIVENSCRPPEGGDPKNHSGQYFLITPKLLPNMVQMEEEAVTVQFVFNGPHNFKTPTEWNPNHIAGLKQLAVAPVPNYADDEDVENSGNAVAQQKPRAKKSRRS